MLGNFKFVGSLCIEIVPISPPVIIMNRIYENQNLLYIVPLIRHTIVVCIASVSPIAIGCSICVNINLVMVLIDISNVLSGEGGILFKMLVLGGLMKWCHTFPLKF